MSQKFGVLFTYSFTILQIRGDILYSFTLNTRTITHDISLELDMRVFLFSSTRILLSKLPKEELGAPQPNLAFKREKKKLSSKTSV